MKEKRKLVESKGASKKGNKSLPSDGSGGGGLRSEIPGLQPCRRTAVIPPFLPALQF